MSRSEWYKFYEGRLNSGYFDYFVDRYHPFLMGVSNVIPKRYFGVAEFGCGMANTTRYLLDHHDSFFYGYDNDPDMLKLATENMGDDKYKVLLHEWDIRDDMSPRCFDVIHTHGVLEHFGDKWIKQIVEYIMKITNVSVHYVPTDAYDSRSFGDERLMHLGQWYSILRDYDLEFETFNKGKDLIITIRNE